MESAICDLFSAGGISLCMVTVANRRHACNIYIKIYKHGIASCFYLNPKEMITKIVIQIDDTDVRPQEYPGNM